MGDLGMPCPVTRATRRIERDDFATERGLEMHMRMQFSSVFCGLEKLNVIERTAS